MVGSFPSFFFFVALLAGSPCDFGRGELLGLEEWGLGLGWYNGQALGGVDLLRRGVMALNSRLFGDDLENMVADMDRLADR